LSYRHISEVLLIFNNNNNNNNIITIMWLETLSLKQLPWCATVPSVTHLDAIVSAVLCQQEIANGSDYREDTFYSLAFRESIKLHIFGTGLKQTQLLFRNGICTDLRHGV
jgi:hypothetical protein